MDNDRKSLILKVAGSIIILILLISQVNWDLQKFGAIVSQMKISWFLLSLTGVIMVLFLKSVRWKVLLKAENCDYSIISSFFAYMSSYTIGLLTPGRIGEIARLYYVREDKGLSMFRSFKSIVTDRIFDLALLFWFGSAGLLFFYEVLGERSTIIYLLVSGLVLFVLWLLGTLVLKVMKSERKLVLFLKESWTEMFELMMLIPWCLTLLSYLLFYVANWLILYSLGYHLSLIEVGFILSIMSLVTLIPITLAGFGTREASLVFLFGFYSLSPEAAIVFSLLQFLAFFFWGGIIGWIIWLYKPVQMSLIKNDAIKVKNWIMKMGSDNKLENESAERSSQ